MLKTETNILFDLTVAAEHSKANPDDKAATELREIYLQDLKKGTQ